MPRAVGAGGSQGGLLPAAMTAVLTQASSGPSQAGKDTPQPPAGVGESAQARNRCFNFRELGHYRPECSQPEVCMGCGSTSHLLRECTEGAPRLICCYLVRVWRLDFSTSTWGD